LVEVVFCLSVVLIPYCLEACKRRLLAGRPSSVKNSVLFSSAVIGALGMIGVVINDSIVLVNKLETLSLDVADKFKDIAHFTSTRLRAVVVTTLTTVAGLFPTAYGFGGYDSMLAEMMLAMGWGLVFGMFITLLLTPCLYSYFYDFKRKKKDLGL